MGVNPISFVNITNHFTLFGGLLKGSHYKKFRHLILLATTWSIWRKRNNIVFRGEFVNTSSLVDQIIYIAWFWLISRGGLSKKKKLYRGGKHNSPTLQGVLTYLP
jgi:hypothetical protein